MVLRGVLVRWGAGEKKHGVGPGDWETNELEAWEKGGRKGTSVAAAHSRLQMVQRAAKARQRRQRKEKADEARRNKDKAKAQREEEQAQKAEHRAQRDQEERKRQPVGHCCPQVEHGQKRGGILEWKWTQGEGRMRTTEQAQEGRGARWLCDWRGANRVVDMKAKGVQFEAVRRAVMGGYLKWEDDSTGGGGGESEVATAEAQGREEAQEGTPESQQIVAVGVEQGRDGDLAGEGVHRVQW